MDVEFSLPTVIVLIDVLLELGFADNGKEGVASCVEEGLQRGLVQRSGGFEYASECRGGAHALEPWVGRKRARAVVPVVHNFPQQAERGIMGGKIGEAARHVVLRLWIGQA